jgi:hypothetical protein
MTVVQLDSEQLGNLMQSFIRKVLKEASRPTGEPTNQLKQHFTIQEAAKFLILTVLTMYNKVSKGELPVMERSKRLFFSKVELIAYLKVGKRKSSNEIETEASLLKTKNGKI